MKEAFRYIDKNMDKLVEDLRKLCRQPSISARGEGIQECAEMVKMMMDNLGIRTRIIPINGGILLFTAQSLNL